MGKHLHECSQTLLGFTASNTLVGWVTSNRNMPRHVDYMVCCYNNMTVPVDCSVSKVITMATCIHPSQSCLPPFYISLLLLKPLFILHPKALLVGHFTPRKTPKHIIFVWWKRPFSFPFGEKSFWSFVSCHWH